jgi:two-component system cell cycle response regulator
MTARILVVDSSEANVRLIEARLMAEYFQVLTATGGSVALEMCNKGLCDLVLVDVKLPQMDGFEFCRKIKDNPKTSSIPVVMVTELDLPQDRAKGLECGADDFLTKPINDLALITRIKSLVRIKSLTDELRLRAHISENFDLDRLIEDSSLEYSSKPRKILIVDDLGSSCERMLKILAGQFRPTVVTDAKQALFRAASEDFDTAVISLAIQKSDPLRFCSHIRFLERAKTLPILAIGDYEHEQQIIRALDLGVNDYIYRPIDPNELVARICSQVKRKIYNTLLGELVQQSIELSVRDELTGLHNRRYLDRNLGEMMNLASANGNPLSLIICDIDHFKRINDQYGHDVGDEVIREFSDRLRKHIRDIDLGCRYGGEEFVVAMPDTSSELAGRIAERLRKEIAAKPFSVAGVSMQLPVSVSVGISTLQDRRDGPQAMMKRADRALYQAKANGRNQVASQFAA